MKHTLALILALISICSILYGCVGGASDSNTDQITDGQVANATGSYAPTSPENETTTQPSENEPDTPAQPEEKTYSATFSGLVAMGIPLECSINYTYSGMQVNARFFLGEDSEIRVESPKGVSQCIETITVIRGTSQYVGCDGKQILVSCDWFKSNYDTARPGRASSFDFSDVPASSISCRDWEYDISVFATRGTTCQLG